jgi:hypothetical protein
MIEPFKRA